MDSLPYKIIGHHLLSARKQLKLSQEEAAKRAYLSHNCYGKIERGEAWSTIDALILLSRVLHLSMQDIFKGVDWMEKDQKSQELTDEDFARFFASMNESASMEKKIVMIGVCRLSESLEE